MNKAKKESFETRVRSWERTFQLMYKNNKAYKQRLKEIEEDDERAAKIQALKNLIEETNNQ